MGVMLQALRTLPSCPSHRTFGEKQVHRRRRPLSAGTRGWVACLKQVYGSKFCGEGERVRAVQSVVREKRKGQAEQFTAKEFAATGTAVSGRV